MQVVTPIEDQINISIDSSGVIIGRKEGGIVSLKQISHKDLLSVFAEKNTRTPLLPSGTVQYLSGEREEVFCFSRPPAMTEIIFDPTRTNPPFLGKRDFFKAKIPMPRLLMIVSLSRNEGNQLKATSIFFLDAPLTSLKQKLYSFLYPNVNRGGGICWGDRSPMVSNSFQAGGLIDLFLNAPFNLDLLHSLKVEVLEEIIKTQKYPYRDFFQTPLGEYEATVNSFIS